MGNSSVIPRFSRASTSLWGSPKFETASSSPSSLPAAPDDAVLPIIEPKPSSSSLTFRESSSNNPSLLNASSLRTELFVLATADATNETAPDGGLGRKWAAEALAKAEEEKGRESVVETGMMEEERAMAVARWWWWEVFSWKGWRGRDWRDRVMYGAINLHLGFSRQSEGFKDIFSGFVPCLDWI